MTQPVVFDHPDLRVTMHAPPGWIFDDSGIADGLVIGTAGAPTLMGFHANSVLIQASLQGQPEDQQATLAGQQEAETGLVRTLRDYRLLHLDANEFGAPTVPGVMRSASYTTEEGVPVIFQQWVARRDGVEVSMTVTFPTALLPAWNDISLHMSSALQWKEAAA